MAVKGAGYLVVASALLLGVSGHVLWYQAWAFLLLTVTMQVLASRVMLRDNADLAKERSRLQPGTKPWDKILVALVALVLPLATFVTAALDVRRHWPPPVPLPLTAAGWLVCAAGGALVFRSMVANRFFSATVRIQSDRGHKVVSAGPYRFVRHPGYVGMIAFNLGQAPALGSWWALVPGVLTAAVLVLRTALEDRTLQAELEGYREYAERVRYRLVTGIW